MLMCKNNQNLIICFNTNLIILNLESDTARCISIEDFTTGAGGKQHSIKKENASISSICLSKCKTFIAVSVDNKLVIVFNSADWKHVRTLTTNRVPSKVLFTNENDLIVADKTGDVYLYKLNSDEPPCLILGHLSIVLDMEMSRCGKYLVTSDRDEKIRVSCFPNSYNIVSYCLGHEEFVTNVKICGDLLISASGDGTVRTWNYLSGLQLDAVNCNRFVSEEGLLEVFCVEMEREKVEVHTLPIKHMEVCCNIDNGKITCGVSLLYSNSIHLLKIDVNGRISFFQSFVFNSPNISFYFDVDLYVLCESNFTVYTSTSQGDYRKSDKDICLSDQIKLKFNSYDDGAIKVLYKRKFDNVQEYLEKKKKRLKK